MPEPLYQSIKRVARTRRTSINRLAQEQLQQLAKAELDARLVAAYEELAGDEETDVTPFFAAQSEVVGRGEKTANG